MNREEKELAARLSLRDAEAADETVLTAIYAATRREELAALGWSEEQFEAFCRMQFALQTQAYKMQFPDAQSSVVELDGRAVGRLLVNRTASEIRLIDIAFLPDFRGLGAGTILIESLQHETEMAGKTLVLRVLTTNPSALRLYGRLGFAVVETNQTHLTMRWSAATEI